MLVGQLELALRVGAGLFVIVAPTLLFLGLWKGLMRLRDENLIETVRRMEDHSNPSPAPAGVTGSTASAIDADGEAPAVCETCGTPNAAGMRFCRECFGTLPDE